MEKKSATILFRTALNYVLESQGRGAQSRLADNTKSSRSLMNDLVKGRTGGSEQLRERIAQDLGYTYEAMIALGRKLAAGDDSKSAKINFDNIEIPGKRVRQIPIISWVQAGDWKEAVEEVATDYVFTDIPNQTLFALKIHGDSMEPKFSDGDIIIVDPDGDCVHDAYVVVMNGEGEATFKQLKIYKETYVLHPLNDKYEEKIVDSKEIRFIGRAVQKIVRERL